MHERIKPVEHLLHQSMFTYIICTCIHAYKYEHIDMIERKQSTYLTTKASPYHLVLKRHTCYHKHIEIHTYIHTYTHMNSYLSICMASGSSVAKNTRVTLYICDILLICRTCCL